MPRIFHRAWESSDDYYSQEQTNGAAPFRKLRAGYTCRASRAELNHDTGVATYFGNARMWQDDNFVRRRPRSLCSAKQKQMDGRGTCRARFTGETKDGKCNPR